MPDWATGGYIKNPDDLAEASDKFDAEARQRGLPDNIHDFKQPDMAALKEMVEKLQRPFFDNLARDIHPTNRKNGFWGEPEMMDKYVAKLALIHSEVTEVLEALRKSQGPDKVTEEFADILIRLFDLYYVLVEAGEADPELFGIMRDKMKVNAEREPKHGNRWG